jgi:hypothetical protein
MWFHVILLNAVIPNKLYLISNFFASSNNIFQSLINLTREYLTDTRVSTMIGIYTLLPNISIIRVFIPSHLIYSS